MAGDDKEQSAVQTITKISRYYGGNRTDFEFNWKRGY